MGSRVSEALVVCYHSVSDDWDHALAVTTRSFERQLSSLLRRGFRPVPAAEVLDGGRRSLHVTFDDAFKAVLQAIPVLERLGLHATVFAVTSLADEGHPLAVPELAREAVSHREHLVTMDWSQLRELAGRGFEIGSHTASHPHLRELSDTELERELVNSRTRIEEELGRPCRLLAYPYGEHDTRVHAAARRSGYAAAFGLAAGTERTNPYALPRTDLYRRDSLVRATMKTSFLKPGASAFLARTRFRPAS